MKVLKHGDKEAEDGTAQATTQEVLGFPVFRANLTEDCKMFVTVVT